MKNESFLPDNQFLHVRLIGGGIQFVLCEYGTDGRKKVGAAQIVGRRELKPELRQAVGLAVLIEMLGEKLEVYMKHRRTHA